MIRMTAEQRDARRSEILELIKRIAPDACAERRSGAATMLQAIEGDYSYGAGCSGLDWVRSIARDDMGVDFPDPERMSQARLALKLHNLA